MIKVFIDTSVFIRFLTRDNQQKFEDCKKFFELIEDGKLRSYTSNIVILEIQFVLIRIYKFSKDKVLNDINSILDLRNLVLIEKTNTQKALKTFSKHNIKYADCLIATQVPKNTKIVTYDDEFSKIKEIPHSQPANFL